MSATSPDLPAVLPVMALRRGVLLPGAKVPFLVGRPRSVAALEAAKEGWFIVAGQRDGSIRDDIAPATIVLALVSLLVGALSDRHLGIYAATATGPKDQIEFGRVATGLIFEGIAPR